jgi:hypothetical protein
VQHAHALLRGALRRSPCSTCASVRSLHAHTAPPSHTESIESAQVLSSMVPCWQSGSTHASPFVSLMTVIFFACLSAVARRRRPVRLPPHHPRVLFTAT